MVWEVKSGGEAQTLTMLGPDKVVFGGHFSQWDGIKRPGVALINLSDGSVDPNWAPVLTAAGGFVSIWETFVDGNYVYIGGLFNSVEGLPRTHFARFALTDTLPPPPECTITGIPDAETLTGTSGDDIICGGEGNDTIKGLGGNDTLKGEGARDRLYGGIGDDNLDGGTGTDTAVYSESLTAVFASLETNTATGEGSDTFLGVEHLTGSTAGDELRGSGGANNLAGGGGNDSIIGLAGADKLLGGAGADTLDSRDGVEGNDTVDGAGGTDTCTTDATELSILNCELWQPTNH